MTLRNDEVVDGRYRVIQMLGQGGMGAVYKAWDTRLDRPVALKEMVPQSGLDAGMLAGLREQFRQEAQILATLVHPNLVRVTDYLSWGGNEYLVMDFVDGDSLADIIRREGAQPEAKVLDWARQLLDALDYCHSHNILHRDIKPQNIIITAEGRAVLVDFGLVKLWDPNDPFTRTVMRGAGTPEYAPPEQYDTHISHTDPRSDIYSLGATLYHALTGQVPPTATQRMASPYYFIPPRQANPHISPATEAVILKSLEIAMDDRFQSAKEMAQAVEAAATGIGAGEAEAPDGSTLVLPPTEQETESPPPHEGTVVLPGSTPAPPPPPPVPPVEEKKRRFLGLSGIGLGLVGCGLCMLLSLVAIGGMVLLSKPGEATAVPPTFPPATMPRVTATAAPVQRPTATAAPVQRPTTAPAPTLPPGGGDVLFQDDFGDSGSGWEVGNYETGDVGYQDGVYFVTSEVKNKVMWGVSGHSWGNLIIDVDAEPVELPDNGNNGYGVACRVQDNGDGYFFFISGDGYYTISRVEGGSFTHIVDWEESSAIRKGSAVNHLRVVCDGPSLILFVNGQMVTSIRDEQFREGDIALTATTYEENQRTVVHFDNLVVRQPSPGGAQQPGGTPAFQGDVIFQDDFASSQSGWEIGYYDKGSVGYKDGAYFVISKNKGSTMWGVANQDFSDLVINVDATQVLAPANNNNDYGVICREQGDGNGYFFLVSGDGYYSIAKAVGGEFTWLVDWTQSPIVEQGNATNHLRVICDGTLLAMFVNGERAAETTDSTYSHGDIALTATTYEEDLTEIHFDNLVVLKPR